MNEPRAAIDRDQPTTATTTREAWRIEWPVWSETTVTTAVLLWRAASDTHASASSEENKLDATDDNYRRQADMTAAVEEHGTLRSYANLWSAASACSMGTRHSMTCSKKSKHRGTERSLSTRASPSHMMVQAPTHWSRVTDQENQ